MRRLFFTASGIKLRDTPGLPQGAGNVGLGAFKLHVVNLRLHHVSQFLGAVDATSAVIVSELRGVGVEVELGVDVRREAQRPDPGSSRPHVQNVEQRLDEILQQLVVLVARRFVADAAGVVNDESHVQDDVTD